MSDTIQQKIFKHYYNKFERPHEPDKGRFTVYLDAPVEIKEKILGLYNKILELPENVMEKAYADLIKKRARRDLPVEKFLSDKLMPVINKYLDAEIDNIMFSPAMEKEIDNAFPSPEKQAAELEHFSLNETKQVEKKKFKIDYKKFYEKHQKGVYTKMNFKTELVNNFKAACLDEKSMLIDNEKYIVELFMKAFQDSEKRAALLEIIKTAK